MEVEWPSVLTEKAQCLCVNGVSVGDRRAKREKEM